MRFHTTYTQIMGLYIVPIFVPVYHSQLFTYYYFIFSKHVSLGDASSVNKATKKRLTEKFPAFTFSYDVIAVIICIVEFTGICDVISFL